LLSALENCEIFACVSVDDLITLRMVESECEDDLLLSDDDITIGMARRS